MEGELIGFDARAQVLVVGVIDARHRVQLSEQAQVLQLLLGRHGGVGGPDEGERLLRIGDEPDARVLRAQVGGAMSGGPAAAIARGHAEDDVLGEVLIQRAESVANPRANRRMV